jgi:hypothetical protein
MKLSKNSKADTVVSSEKWKCFDGCPVCRMMREAAESGKEINGKELEKAFAEAEVEVDAD